MIASSPAVPKHKHVLSVPLTDSAFPAVHDGQPSSPFTVQHPLEPGEDPSLHTYAFAESIRDDAHAMSAKKKKEKKKGVFVNAPPLELLVVLVNIIPSSLEFLLRSLVDKSPLYVRYFYPFFRARKDTKRNILARLEKNKTQNTEIIITTSRAQRRAVFPQGERIVFYVFSFSTYMYDSFTWNSPSRTLSYSSMATIVVAKKNPTAVALGDADADVGEDEGEGDADVGEDEDDAEHVTFPSSLFI